ncbi:MAG: glycoside hydrolase family 3 C-terminal domain-containing protein, partial [Eubacteriales bacterium]|nr:glycoside hydrolase family 3 C-terminal domain-containing protein [Eubacteriales bacterium]
LAIGKPVVVVLSSGSALAVSQGNAVLEAWYPGEAGGTALARILFGEVSPSGRLPVTFYHGIADLPDFTDYAMRNRTYRYFTGEPLFPFGYGLSYTRFMYSGATYANGEVSVTVTNAGEVEADEVIQVYVKDHDSPCAAANHSLCAFKRVTLGKGEKATVSLPLRKEAFAVVDEDGRWTRQSKHFSLCVGGSQPDARSAALLMQKPLEIDVRL